MYFTLHQLSLSLNVYINIIMQYLLLIYLLLKFIYLFISWRLTRYNEIWRRVTNLSLMSIVLKMSIKDREEWIMVFSVDDSYLLTVSTVSFSLNLL